MRRPRSKAGRLHLAARSLSKDGVAIQLHPTSVGNFDYFISLMDMLLTLGVPLGAET